MAREWCQSVRKHEAFIKQNGHKRLFRQATFFQELLAHRRLSARELARQLAAASQELGTPRLKASHQAVSGWINGTRQPTFPRRRLLSIVLQIPLAEIDRACEADAEPLEVPGLFQPMTVVVRGPFQRYEYRLAIKKSVDITKTAVYEDWTAMFDTRPIGLLKHVRLVKADRFGWIPDRSANPLVEHTGCMVPLKCDQREVTLRVLDSAESCHRKVWFVYLPSGNLQVGIGYRDRRTFRFVQQIDDKLVSTSYPFSRVDLVGHFVGSVLFYLAPKAEAMVVAS